VARYTNIADFALQLMLACEYFSTVITNNNECRGQCYLAFVYV